MSIAFAEFDFFPGFNWRIYSYIAPVAGITSRHILKFPLLAAEDAPNVADILLRRTVERKDFGIKLTDLEAQFQSYGNCVASKAVVEVSTSDTFDVTVIFEGSHKGAGSSKSPNPESKPVRLLTSNDAFIVLKNDSGEEMKGDRLSKLSVLADADMKLVHGNMIALNKGLQKPEKTFLDFINSTKGKGQIDFGYTLASGRVHSWLANIDKISMEAPSRSIKEGLDIVYARFRAERKY